jgi:hypothetical protein
MSVRIDLSKQLIHLTRGSMAEVETAFRSIVKDRALRGSNRGIRGKHTVVCFSEAPVDVLAKMFREDGRGFRYRPFGVMVPKTWLFDLGGCPAIYQPEADFELLPESLRYRHVRFDHPGAPNDFSFEREWRIETKTLTLDPGVCTLVVPDREWDYKLREEHYERDMIKARYLGFNPFTRITKYEWHVLALGDLGASFPLNDDAGLT